MKTISIWKEKIISVLQKIISIIRLYTVSELIAFSAVGLILISSGFAIVWKINNSFLVEVPKNGGSLSEGLIGTPRFVNPLLAVSDTDRDIVSLVYSGLMRVGPSGTLIPDLAENYAVSTDGTVYTFTLRKNARFSDGTPVTADDVVFTIQRAQDPTLKSPRRATWEDIVVEKVDDQTVTFTIKKGPYSPFIVNTTLGILPKHIWKDAEQDEFVFSPFNTEPVGSGPYKINSITRNASGIPQAYSLVPFKDFVLGSPHISQINLHFYTNEKLLIDAYTRGEVESVGSLSAAKVQEISSDIKKTGGDIRIERFPLPRVLGVFFNQNQNKILALKEVRQALNIGLDRNSIINKALSGYGTELYGPIPPGLISSESLTGTATSTDEASRIASAQKILTDAGWKLNDKGMMELPPAKSTSKTKTSSKATSTLLAFSIATSDTSEFKLATELIAEQWRKIGADVTVQVFESSDLNQSVIRPRKYDSLFFGEIIGRDFDFFGFWHSKQRLDPGLNIAMYTNAKVDTLLETARTEQDFSKRIEKYKQFQTEVINDTPAVFVYAPDFIYILPRDIYGVELYQITTPADRFQNIYEWYRATDKVWKIFKK